MPAHSVQRLSRGLAGKEVILGLIVCDQAARFERDWSPLVRLPMGQEWVAALRSPPGQDPRYHAQYSGPGLPRQRSL